jgi:hypothetical protein
MAPVAGIRQAGQASDEEAEAKIEKVLAIDHAFVK